MKVGVVLLAAGGGARFGGDKVLETVSGKPVWQHSFDTFLSHPRIDQVGIVASPSNIEAIKSVANGASFVILGGSSRQESSAKGVQACEADWVLIHDAARPFVPTSVIDDVLGQLGNGASGSAPALESTDTIRLIGADGELTLYDRTLVRRMQTPQAVVRNHYLEALAQSSADFTDDLELLAQAGYPITLVPGANELAKITFREDLPSMNSTEFRTGLGYDIHSFSDDPERVLWLGGVPFPGVRALDGHSDADVLIHAAVDAILGAVAMGDIGQLFPNDDPTWKNAASKIFLAEAIRRVRSENWDLVNLDLAVVAEEPKIMKRSAEIREALASILNTSVDRVSLKATTNERLGAIGRKEGIAAFATATLRR